MTAAAKTFAQRFRLLRFSQILRSPSFWAVALRVAVFWMLSPIQLKGDAGYYHTIAANLASGHGFSRCPGEPFLPTAQRPPLFPFILSAVYLLGAGALWAPFILNLIFDLFSLRVARRWAEEAALGASTARKLAWFIALCPLLITYAAYPTTENLSVLLFLAATLFMFRLGRLPARGALSAALSGVFWGLLALCRSYFLLFPILLLIWRPSLAWRRRWLAILVTASFAAPAVWIARNQAVFGRPVFSQGAAVGWQAYQGLCFTNFDWWNQEHVADIYAHPVLSRMLAADCAPDEVMGELDRVVKAEVWNRCVLGDPGSAAYNVVVKGTMLFINWGQFLPYTEIPETLRWLVNGLLAFYWWCALCAFWQHRRAKGSAPARRYAIAGLAYVAAVTVPFAVDARYLLGPFIISWAVAISLTGSVGGLTLAGLKACWPFRRRA